jgi:hypothetical protein
MKVVCINNTEMDVAMETSVNLTIGKVYNVIGNVSYQDSVFPIINDIGKKGTYYNGRFESLEENRSKKLNKILE